MTTPSHRPSPPAPTTSSGAAEAPIRRVAMISLHTSPLDQPGTGDAGGMNVYVLELSKRLAAQGIELRGGAADEAPDAYKRLDQVLAAHGGTVEIVHRLTPIGVAMAGADEFDPYKD